MTCGGQPMKKSVLYPPRQGWYQFSDRAGMEDLVGLYGKSEPRTWYKPHTTAGPSSTALHAPTTPGMLTLADPACYKLTLNFTDQYAGFWMKVILLVSRRHRMDQSNLSFITSSILSGIPTSWFSSMSPAHT